MGPAALPFNQPDQPQLSELITYKIAAASMITSQGVWRPVLRLVDIDSRTAAELLKGRPIYLPMEELPLDAEEEYLWASLIGRKVITLDSIELGMIAQIENHGAHDIVCIRQGARQVDIPFISHFFPMDFSPTPDGQPLRLLTKAEDFSDLWYEVEGG
jgi:16S rRNA processing protein RimM